MNRTQTLVVDAVTVLQIERDELAQLLTDVVAADTGPGPDGQHHVHLPAELMAGIRARLS